MKEETCRGCEALEDLRADFEAYKSATDKRLAEGSTQFAVINTKLSAILWGVGAVATALIGVLVKILFA